MIKSVTTGVVALQKGRAALFHPHLNPFPSYVSKEQILTLILFFSLRGRRKFRKVIFRYRGGN